MGGYKTIMYVINNCPKNWVAYYKQITDNFDLKKKTNPTYHRTNKLRKK